MTDYGVEKTENRIERFQIEKQLGRAVSIAIICLISGIAIWYTSTLTIVLKDTLNTLNDQQQEINDLRTDVYNLGLLYQNGEKEASRGEYERTEAYLGEFDITYYCGCEKCCGKTDKITKLGTTATAGRTAGADWNTLQPGTKIYIDGIGERVVEDTGGGIQGNHIDVFVDNHQEALQLGRATRKVYTVEQ